MLGIFCWSLTISLGINFAMFLIAFRLQSDKLTDASYAVSFLALAIFAFAHSTKTAYAVISALLVGVWALRIGSFLVYRVLRAGSDQRFDGMRERFWQFGKFWLGQAVTVWILMIPTTLALTGNAAWRAFSLLGAMLWLAGFLLESVADLQKYRFTHNPARKNQWIDSGVWRFSRHPNYFGEMLVWLGIYLYALPDLSAGDKLIGIVSPLFITVLLVFVSGIPILEKSADKRWGNIPAYQTYKQRTSLLVPLPPRNTNRQVN